MSAYNPLPGRIIEAVDLAQARAFRDQAAASAAATAADRTAVAADRAAVQALVPAALPLGVTNGGTGSNSAAGARANLGLSAIASSGSASDLAAGTVPDARLPTRLSVNGVFTTLSVSGTATVADATAAGHAVNRQTGDARYAQLATAASFSGLLTGRGVASRATTGAGTVRTSFQAVESNGTTVRVALGVDASEVPTLWTYDTAGAPANKYVFNASGTLQSDAGLYWHSGNFNPTGFAPLNGPVFTGTPSVSGAPASFRLFEARTAGVVRWAWGADSAPETGANAGSSWNMYRYSDAGVLLGTPMSVNRSTGVVNFEATPRVSGSNVWHAGTFDPASRMPVATTASGVGQFVWLTPGINASLTLPVGGTWAYFGFLTDSTNGAVGASTCGISAGGTLVGASAFNSFWSAFAWRIT